MNNSENPQQNVIQTNRFGSTNTTESAEKLELTHLQHCSAEINTACREGFYVHMLEPEITVKRVVIDATTGDVDIETSYRLRYEIVELDPKRIIEVDHRDTQG
jgi:hypothetical protein